MIYKRKIKRYAGGGYFDSDNPDFDKNVNGAAKAADFTGNFLQTVAPDSTIGDVGGGALKGAAAGAEAGLAFGPEGAIIGGAVGLVGGAIGGVINHGKKAAALKQQIAAQERQRVLMQQNHDSTTLAEYNTAGNYEQGYYARGGTMGTGFMKPQQVNGFRGYRSMANPRFYPRMAEGGPIDSTIYANAYGRPMNGVAPLAINTNTPYSKNNPIMVEKRDGSIGQWGNPLLPNNSIPALIAPNVMPAQYSPTSYDNLGQVGRTLPRYPTPQTQYPSSNYGTHYGDGGDIDIKPSHRGRFTTYKARTGETTEEALHSDNPHVRKMAQFAKNASTWKHADGGYLSPYHTGNVIDRSGRSMAEGGVIPLASDTQKFVGPSHAQGGIPIDPNGDGHAEAEVEGDEVQKGNQIYSDRLNPSPQLLQMLTENKVGVKPTATYADIATKLGRLKGKYETKLTLHSPMALRTGKAMTDRVDNLMQAAFQDQEAGKVQSPQAPQMANGGIVYDDGGDFDGTTMITTLPPLGAVNAIMSAQKTPLQHYLDKLPPNASPQQIQAAYDAYHTGTVAPSSTAPIAPISGSNPPIVAHTPMTTSGARTTVPAYRGRKAAMLQATGLDAINLTNTDTPATKDAILPQMPAPTQSPILADSPQSTTMDGVNSFVDRYGADVMNAASYFGNQAAINRMKAPQFQTVAAPNYSYKDRSGLNKYENQVQAEAASRGVTNTSAQGRSAEKAAIYAQEINGNNQINNAENQRHDAYDTNYDNRVAQNAYTNTDIMNRQADLQTQVNNEKVAAGIKNRNAFNAGTIENQQTRDKESLDNQKALTILASTQDPDRALSLLTKFMSPEKAKRLQQLYRRN